jgi:hypothetical protein
MRLAIFFFFLICLRGGVFAQEIHSSQDDGADTTWSIEGSSTDAQYVDDDGLSEGEGDGVTDEEEQHALIPPQDLETTRRYLQQEIQVQKFDKQKWKEIVGDADYNEDERKQSTAPAIPPWGGAVLKIVSYGIILGIIIFLLYFIIKNVSIGPGIERTTLQADSIEKAVDNIRDVDLDQLLLQARAEGNLRLSIRLYYLRMLKRLDEAGIIGWKKDKTNRDYLTELFRKDYHYDEVRTLTRSYEEVWYGEHDLTESDFQSLSAHFETVFAKLKNGSTR